ncbi:MAG: Hsp20/alpha crystallin family protein [Pseudorhodobacter sp.]|nr:Hsp20/alpha crystallin family protein [Pseudorhodobacter sp.]
MAKKNLVEVKQEKATPLTTAGRQPPLVALRNEIDQLFEDFGWPDFGFPLLRRTGSVEPVRQLRDIWVAAPAMDLVERNGEYEVQAELPGLTIGDVEVKLSEGMLTIRGEKSAERKEDEEDYHLRERSYGEFQRCFRLPNGIDADKVEAKFENGVLSVRIPKSAEAKKKERKIEVKNA